VEKDLGDDSILTRMKADYYYITPAIESPQSSVHVFDQSFLWTIVGKRHSEGTF